MRIGAAACEYILDLTIKAGVATKAVSPSSFKAVNVDAMMQTIAVTFPTDTRLLPRSVWRYYD